MSKNYNINMDGFINHYKILGISQKATRKEIANSYKKLCLIYHPDKPTGDAVMFEQINDSYLVLKDPVSRQQYDLSLITATDKFDFVDMRDSFKEYIKTPDNFIPKIDESIFVPLDVKNQKIKVDDSASMLDDLSLIREQDDLENLPKKLFDEKEFDDEKFHCAFKNGVDELDITEDINEEWENKSKNNYGDLFSGSCRATNLDSTFNDTPFGPDSESNKTSEFLSQFSVTKNIKGTRNTTDVLDKDYFSKLMADRDNIFETIEYSNIIEDGVDYKAIGFL